jgi:antirestriction protein ArdC
VNSVRASILASPNLTKNWGDRNIIGRKQSVNPHSPEYAFEELVAEIAACFLCRACGVPTEWENHESYIVSWLRAMKNNTAYIIEASRDASKIADAILLRVGIKDVQESERA